MPVILTYFQFGNLVQRFTEQALCVLYHMYEPYIDDETFMNPYEIMTQTEYDIRCGTVSQSTP